MSVDERPGVHEAPPRSAPCAYADAAAAVVLLDEDVDVAGEDELESDDDDEVDSDFEDDSDLVDEGADEEEPDRLSVR